MDWIQGHKFQQMSTWTFKPHDTAPCDYYCYSNTLDLSKLKDGDIIYTQGFTHYKHALLNIIRGTKNVILISHNCDNPVDDSFDIPDNVIIWYAQNVTTMHPKVSGIPTGLENDIRDFGKNKKEKMLAKMNETKNIKNLVYIDHRIGVNPAERTRPYQVLSNKPWVTAKTDTDNVSYDVYLDNLYNHKFVICPWGNGISTHRPWEAMYMNTIPIERRDTNNRFYRDMPICFINDWDELTEDFLNNEYNRIINLDWDKEMLTFAYWKNKIISTR